MSRMKKGNGLLRFLIFAVLSALVLTGCNGARKYEAVDLSSETAAGAEMSGNGADLVAESTDTGTSGSGDADVQALGEAAGEPLSADPEGGDVASESSELAEAASESEELSSEMSEAESVEAAREAAAAAYTAAASDDAETAPEIPFNGHMHVWPTVESGRMAIMDGYLMASCDNFRITVRGRGAHSMTPQLGRDAVAAAAAVIREVQTIAARMNKPDSPLVISIGTVESERVDGRICERVSMEGTFRAFDIRSQRLALEMIEHIADSAAAIYGCTAEFEHTFSGYAVNNRDTALNALARDAARKLFGEDVLQTTAKAMGSEDFAYILWKEYHRRCSYF